MFTVPVNYIFGTKTILKMLVLTKIGVEILYLYYIIVTSETEVNWATSVTAHIVG